MYRRGPYVLLEPTLEAGLGLSLQTGTWKKKRDPWRVAQQWPDKHSQENPGLRIASTTGVWAFERGGIRFVKGRAPSTRLPKHGRLLGSSVQQQVVGGGWERGMGGQWWWAMMGGFFWWGGCRGERERGSGGRGRRVPKRWDMTYVDADVDLGRV